MALSADAQRVFEVAGIENTIPVAASVTIFKGAAVGTVAGTGLARGLVAGDGFAGFALHAVTNGSTAAAVNVQVARRGGVQLAITGAVITDVGQPVYASADGTFAMTPVGGTYVGRIVRFVSTGVVMVAFDADLGIDPYGLAEERETVSVDKTLDAEDTGKIFFVDTDAKTITLPVTATAGLGIKIVNIGAFGTVAVNVSPQSGDSVQGPDGSAVDDKDIINTKATARRGDYIVVNSGHAAGWVVSEIRGIWAKE